MKNILKNLGKTSLLALPFLYVASAHAQFSSSTAITTVNTMTADTGYIIGAVITAIIALSVALTGLGWGYRKFKQHVSGRKF